MLRFPDALATWRNFTIPLKHTGVAIVQTQPYKLAFWDMFWHFTLLEANISRFKGTFKDNFPFPRVGYVSSQEGTTFSITPSIYVPKSFWQVRFGSSKAIRVGVKKTWSSKKKAWKQIISTHYNTLGIQSPSENANGTQILCWGGDWTPQSSAENMTGCLETAIGPPQKKMFTSVKLMFYMLFLVIFSSVDKKVRISPSRNRLYLR